MNIALLIRQVVKFLRTISRINGHNAMKAELVPQLPVMLAHCGNLLCEIMSDCLRFFPDPFEAGKEQTYVSAVCA